MKGFIYRGNVMLCYAIDRGHTKKQKTEYAFVYKSIRCSAKEGPVIMGCSQNTGYLFSVLHHALCLTGLKD